MSDRNGVPDSASRRAAPPKASSTDVPQARSSPAWWSSSNTTKAPAETLASGRADDATCW